jgi:hypothetical protein
MSDDHLRGANPMTVHAFTALKDLINTDTEYAWAWHCNLAVPIMDAACVNHATANEAAALIMAQMFDHDITQHPQYQGEKSGAQIYFEARVEADRADT